MESSLSLLAFVSELSNLVGSLLSLHHNFESVEISGLGSQCKALHLLVGWCVGPLGVQIKLLSSSGNSAGSCSSEKWKSQLSEGKSNNWIDASWEVSNAIDKHSVGVKDIDNDNNLSIVLSEIDIAYSTCFNEVSNSLKSYE